MANERGRSRTRTRKRSRDTSTRSNNRSRSTPRTPRRNMRNSPRTSPTLAGTPARSIFRRSTVSHVHQQAEGMIVRSLPPIIMYKKKPKHGKLLGTYKYLDQSNWIVSALQGRQTTDYLEHIMNRNQLIGLTSSTRNDRTKYADNMFFLNPFYARPASVLYAAETGLTRSDNLYLKSCKVTLNLLSLVQYPQQAVVYYMTPVNDTNVNPIDAWNGILDSKQLGQAGATAAQVLATTTAAAGHATSGDVGANPFHHREFRSHWKAVSTAKFTLQAGEQITFKQNIDFEKIINYETLAIRQSLYLKGLTIIPVVISYGGLVGIALNAGTATTEVSYGAPKIGCVSSYQFVFGALPQSRFSSARQFDGNIFNSLDTQKVIDDNDTVIVPAPA